VLLGYSATLDPSRPNVVVVAGRNLSGCLLDVGANATIHIQKSDDDVVAGIVTLPANQPPPELSVRSKFGAEVARFEMEFVQSSKSGDTAAAMAEDGPGEIDVTLTAAPGQQIVAPTEQDNTVFRTSSATGSPV